jgi:inosine/xanthosine triphosphate pyrophosphatase family protein
MSKVNAHGGFLVIDGAPPVRLDNTEHELDLEAIIDDTTDSGSGGSAQGLPCIVKVNSVTTSIAEDSVAYPEALGLTPGVVVTIWCRRGSINQYDQVVGTIMKSLRKINDNNGKARRAQIVFEYGVYLNNVAPPAGFGG